MVEKLKAAYMSGVIESYSKRWDKGSYDLASAFITQTAGDEYYKTLMDSGAIKDMDNISESVRD